MDLELARNFLTAIAIGGLVGLEREMKILREGGSDAFGGIRTYPLFAVLGATSAWMSNELGLWAAFPVALAICGLAVVASYILQNRASTGALGLVGELAAIAVFLLAAMAVAGMPELAVTLSVVVLALLTFKQRLHGAVAKLESDDLLAGTKLLIASFVVLPLLPDWPVDPWQALNPYKLWLLVVLVSGLSLVGYLAMRWLGSAYGIAVTAISGALVSSTATTVSLARASQQQADSAALQELLGGVMLGWLVMFVRMVVIATIVNHLLLNVLWPPMLAMALVCAAVAAWQYRAGWRHRSERAQAKLPIKNPFSLSAAIKFGLLFAVVLLVVKLAQQYGTGSVYAVAALSGTVDVDAITLSLASNARPEAADAVANALVIAALSNTVVKCGMVFAAGDAALRRPVVLATAAIAAAGIAVMLLR